METQLNNNNKKKEQEVGFMNHETGEPRGASHCRHGWIRGLMTSSKLCHSLHCLDRLYLLPDYNLPDSSIQLPGLCPVPANHWAPGLALLSLTRPGLWASPFGGVGEQCQPHLHHMSGFPWERRVLLPGQCR